MVMEPGSGLYCSAGRGNRRPFAARRRLPPVKDQLVGLELRYRDEGSRSRYFHRGIYFAQRARGMAQRNGQAAIDRRVRQELDGQGVYRVGNVAQQELRPDRRLYWRASDLWRRSEVPVLSLPTSTQ